MADDVPVSSGKKNVRVDETSSDNENESSKKIIVHVKTHKEKESFEVFDNVSVKDVSSLTMCITLILIITLF